MSIRIPRPDEGHMLWFERVKSESNFEIIQRFLTSDECKWLDANGWELDHGTFDHRTVLIKQAPYPMEFFVIYLDDTDKFIASIMMMSQVVQNPRGGNYNFVAPINKITGDDPIDLARKLLKKGEEIIDLYAQECKREMQDIIEMDRIKSLA